MTDANTEIELKLALSRGSLGRVRSVIGDLDLDRASIEDVYFDTTEEALRQRGIVLRLRREGNRWLQTLKATKSAHSLVPERGEWEVPAATGNGPPRLDLERFDIEPLRVLMRGGLDPAALVPVFRTSIERRRGLLAQGQSEIEVALDRGELRAIVDGRRRRLKVAELELELKSGQPEDLLEVGTSIVRRCEGLTLVPALRSKSERGYALRANEKLKAVRASSRGFAALIEPSMTSADALRAIVRHAVAIVVANADALRGGPDTEHVHQARVALRRMRSAIRLFDPHGDDFPSRLTDELHWLSSVLGEARDWDVLVDDTLPLILSGADPKHSSYARLVRAAQKQRKRCVQRAVEAVSSRRYARLILRLARWSTRGTDAPAPSVAEVTAALLEQAADRLFKDARSFERLGRHRQHRVRIHAKRLRYALDLLASLLPGRVASDYIEALAELQDSLGELNDAAVARSRLGALVRDEDGDALLQEWHARVRPDLVSHAARQIAALDHRPRPWSLVWTGADDPLTGRRSGSG